MNPMLAMMMFGAVAMKAAKDPFGLWNLHTPSAPATPAADQDAGSIPGQTVDTP